MIPSLKLRLMMGQSAKESVDSAIFDALFGAHCSELCWPVLFVARLLQKQDLLYVFTS